eukprot:CAMPEP_0177637748 /NCGR_PEP_ID=MMETSP0447-20121125/5131_1 /TAXON_ID=0 /ORGANISM="Stygamoeba regulata, Strain BSH-02190019" /LENGTH=273 /DNA_ID=CAMNT_0019139685 /DNA_START=239 /DNA_END=1060 /DNA_ORIENTATION=+
MDKQTLDPTILREVWDGELPVQLTLAPSEVTTLDAPAPFYLMVRRLGYLIVDAAVCKDYFMSSTVGGYVNEMWLEFNGKPLRWHLPTGVLFDLYGQADALPWKLVVHFQGYPTDQLLRCPDDETVQKHFMNVLKEANYLKHGDSSKVNSLSIADQNGLWKGLRTNQFDLFHVSNNLLAYNLDSPSLAVRICQPHQPLMQEPVEPVDDDGNDVTLLGFLKQMLPKDFAVGSSGTQVRVLVQGIEPPLACSLRWLAERFSHCDNFLYICVLPRTL